jgi:hypothetical protein
VNPFVGDPVSNPDYLFGSTPGTTTPFPDDVRPLFFVFKLSISFPLNPVDFQFRMISGNIALRTYNSSSFAQQAVTFLCLDFQGTSTRYNALPNANCPSGIRSQLNFPSCWDGKNVDSPDHKSHVAFLSGGADVGTCSDPKFPKTLPRIFAEVGDIHALCAPGLIKIFVDLLVYPGL